MKHKKTLACLALALCTLFTLAACDQASAGGKDTLVFGTSADYPPYEFHILDENGKDTIVGFDVALAQQIADDMGKDLVIKDMAFEYLMQELENGTIDMVLACISPTPERLEVSDFSDAYYQDLAPMMLVRAEDKDTYNSIESLAGKTIGVQSATTKLGLLKEHMPDSQLLELAAVPDLISNLLSNKCEAVFLDGGVAVGYTETNENLVVADGIQIGEGDVLGVAVKKGDPKDLLGSINKTIAKCLKDGSLDTWYAEAEQQSVDAAE